ncbi:MAG: lactoylglutathione lyase [Pseudomonadota bacterium]
MSEQENSNAGYRISHTMIRIRSLEKSLIFYCDILGMKVLRNTDYPDGRFTNTFIGYGEEATHPTIELTCNWDQEDDYEKGNGWGHLAFEVPDIFVACDKLAEAGIKITRAPGPMKHGTRNIAFVEDPDGYKVELNEPIW